ncbi:MAG: acyltransferase [Deltaproteobacteria bacterium]|nr:acyltransferase [Deltaproteobacteria bacterium]
MINSQEEVNRPKSLNALTSLRFFAAAVIVIHHSKGSFGLDSQWLMELPTSQPVSFFFVLSGFILVYVYPSLKGMKDVSRFLIARFARIWPLHVVTFLLVLLFIPANLRNRGGMDIPSLILTNLCMVQSWVPIWNYYFSYNWLSWAISTEFAFYLFFPWLLNAWHRTWHIKLLCALLMVVAIISYANMADLPSGEAMGTTEHVGYAGLVNIFPLGRLFEFALGMALALAFPRMTSILSPGRTFGTIIEGVALSMAVGIMAMSPFIARSIFHYYPWIGESGKKWLLIGGLPCGFYGLLILLMAMEKGLFSRLLSRGFLRGLGEMSLSIFLLHQILVRYYQWRIEDITNLPNWFLYGFLWAVLLLGSYVLMILIEHPCRQFILGKVHVSRLIRKRHILFAGCSLIIMLIAVPHYLNGALTPKNAIDQTSAAKIIGNWDTQYQQIQFGNKFLLRGANLEKRSNRIRLQLIWESMNDQLLKYTVAVHVLDDSRRTLFQADYPQNRGQILVRDHVIWREETEIPLEELSGATAIAIVLYSIENLEALLPDCGDRDRDNKRLLMLCLYSRIIPKFNRNNALKSFIRIFYVIIDFHPSKAMFC